MKRALAGIVSVVLGAGILLTLSNSNAVAASGPPTSAPGQVRCSLEVTLTFSPPLTSTGGGTNPTIVSGKFTECTHSTAAVIGGRGKLSGTIGTSSPPVSCPGQPSVSSGTTLAATWEATYTTSEGNFAVGPSSLSTSGEQISIGSGIGLQFPGSGNAATTTGSFARSSPDGWSADLTSKESNSTFDSQCRARHGVKKLKFTGSAIVGVTYGFNGPRAMATDGTDVWVTNYFDQGDSVTEFDASTGAWVRTITGFSNPVGISYADSHVFVNSAFSNSVTELDAATGDVIATLSGGSYGFNGIETEVSDGSNIWFLNDGNNTVTEIDGSTGDWIQTLSDSSYGFNGPQAAVFDGTNLWIANGAGNSVTEIDASTGALVNVLSGDAYSFDNPNSIAFDGTNLWVTNEADNSVTELDTSGDVLQTLSGGSYGFDLPGSATSDGAHVWLTNFGDDTITEFDVATGSWIQTQPATCNLASLPFDTLFADGNVFVSEQTDKAKGADCVEDFDASTGGLVQTLMG